LNDRLKELEQRTKCFNSETISFDEVKSWPEGELDELVSGRVLEEIELSKTVVCDQCPEHCTIEPERRTIPQTGEVVGFHVCSKKPDGERQIIKLERFRQWRISKNKLDEIVSGEEQKSNISGMTWQQAKTKAEALVREKGYLGFVKLIEAVGCSEGTLRKVITGKSSFLKQEKETYESISKTLRAVGLTAEMVATYEGKSDTPQLSDAETKKILAEILERIQKEQPDMYEPTKKQIDEMSTERKREFAKVYQRDYQNKKSTLKKGGPKTQRQYKQV
jgi:predicted transcriptional regulator